ncbi:MAG: 50S ribosomal protein L35 [Verrucomicrobia bacterium ADurb.Bin345]|nr:MAG: 50S ribosomal protein L35 [Verrucomicrobia bacterium ADurb.Bin345]
MAKFKTKTKKAAAKRFKVTARGKIKRPSTGRGHLLGHKSRKRKRRLRHGAYVSGADHARIALLLPK